MVSSNVCVTFLNFELKKIYLFMCMRMYVRVPPEVRRGRQILGSQRYR